MFNKTKLKKDLNTFLKLYKKRPIKNNHSGMKIDLIFFEVFFILNISFIQ